MTTFKNILLTITSILIIIYIICYYIPPKTISINQTYIQHFKLHLLYERHPIIIYNPIPNIQDITQKWFQYNFITQTTSENIKWKRNLHKYLVVYPLEDTEIHICNPYTNIIDGLPCADSKIITINLKKNQIIIIPYRWYIYTDLKTELIHIHDIITYILSYTIRSNNAYI
jgi:hypothetical protein